MVAGSSQMSILSFFRSWRFAGFVGMFITGFAVMKYVTSMIIITLDENINLFEEAFTDASVTAYFVYIIIHGVVFSLITYRMYKRKLLFSRQK